MLPVLVFDGDCGFCTTAAGWVTSRLRPTPMSYAVEPAQCLDLPALGLTVAQCEEALQFVDGRGRINSGLDAIAAVLSISRWWARPVGRVLGLPGVRGVGRAAYAIVARHRHRLPGGTPACALPARERD